MASPSAGGWNSQHDFSPSPAAVSCPQHGPQYMGRIPGLHVWRCKAKYAVMDSAAYAASNVSMNPSSVQLQYAVCGWQIGDEALRQEEYRFLQYSDPRWGNSSHAALSSTSNSHLTPVSSSASTMESRGKTEVEQLRARVEGIRKVGREALAS